MTSSQTNPNIPIAVAVPSSNPTQPTFAQLPNTQMAHFTPTPYNNEAGPMTGQAHIVTRFAGTEAMALTWRFGRTVRFFAAIDLIFVFLYALSYPVFLFAGILPLLGYQGAKEYNVCKTRSYGLFVLLGMGLRIYAYTLQQGTGNLVLCILSVFVQCWILRILYQFTKYIRALTETEAIEIRQPGWAPLQTSLVWF